MTPCSSFGRGAGVGKTVILNSLYPELIEHCDLINDRVLLLAHRDELIDQLSTTAQQLNPHLNVQIEQASRYADADADVVVASVPTLGRSDLKRIERFDIDHFGVIVIDECVTGDTEVITDVGAMPIKNISQSTASTVLTWDGKYPVFRKIRGWKNQGVKPIWKVKLKSGKEIRCTANHPLWTPSGWISTEAIQVGSKILSCVNADVDNWQEKTNGTIKESMSQDTETTPWISTKNPKRNGKRILARCSPMPLNVNAVVSTPFILKVKTALADGGTEKTVCPGTADEVEIAKKTFCAGVPLLVS